MITTGQVLSESTQTFTPIISRLGEIAGEFVPYFTYIGLGIIAIELILIAVKYITIYQKRKANELFERRQKYRDSRRKMKLRRELLEYYNHGIRTKGMQENRDERGLGKRPGERF